MEITYQINHFNLKFSFVLFFLVGVFFLNYWLEFYLNWIELIVSVLFAFARMNTFEFVDQINVFQKRRSVLYHNSWYRPFQFHWSLLWIFQHTICLNFIYLHNFKRCFDYWDLLTFWFHVILCLCLIFELVVNWWWIRFRAFLFQQMRLKCVWRAKLVAMFSRCYMRPAECTQQRFLCATYAYGIGNLDGRCSVLAQKPNISVHLNWISFSSRSQIRVINILFAWIVFVATKLLSIKRRIYSIRWNGNACLLCLCLSFISSKQVPDQCFCPTITIMRWCGEILFLISVVVTVLSLSPTLPQSISIRYNLLLP